jgi:release factor glutamine methyltransferase
MADVLELIKKISAELERCDEKAYAEQEAWWLLEKATGKSTVVLLTACCIELSEQQQKQLDEWVRQRVEEQKPIAYIFGSVPFCDLDVKVKPPILIPRPETEEWVSWLIGEIKEHGVTTFTALDLCCGSGCIGLALAKAFPESKILGVDINPEAIELSLENRELNKIQNIEFIQSDLYQKIPLDFKCDLIVSNPPYLAKEEFEGLAPEVKKWEDRRALLAEMQGMEFYDRILRDARKFLSPTRTALPCIVFEVGPAQRDIESLFKKYGFRFKLYLDMQGKPRWYSCW